MFVAAARPVALDKASARFVASAAPACRPCGCAVPLHPQACSSRQQCNQARTTDGVEAFQTSRRAWLFLAASAGLPQVLRTGPAVAGGELAEFTDRKGVYTLQRPKEWEQVDKAGADVLFKAPNLRSTDLGVTVSPIRIKRLDQLGDAAAVGDRLLAAEKKKESTKSAELLGQSSQTGESGTTYFVFDYTVSTTRGDKRILSKVGVAGGKLYIVNGSIKCEGGSCREETELVTLVRDSVQSFDLKG